MAIRTVGRKKIVVTLNALTAVPISATTLFTTDFEVYFPSANGGSWGYIGDSTVDSTWIPRKKAEAFNFVSGTGSLSSSSLELGFNLANIYIQGSGAGDTAIVEYMHYDRS